MSKKITKKKPKVAVQPLYRASLLLNGSELVSEGKDLLEALKGVKIGVCKTRGVLKVEKEGKKTERYLNIRQMKKLFGPDSFSRKIALESTMSYITKLIK